MASSQSYCESWIQQSSTSQFTHWGRATHICVGKLTITGSDNGVSPGRRQAIISTIAGVLLIGPLGISFSEILIGIQTFSFKEMHLLMSSAKRCPSCLGLSVLRKVSYLHKASVFATSWTIVVRQRPAGGVHGNSRLWNREQSGSLVE